MTADGDVLSISIPRNETGGDPAFPRADAARALLRMLLLARCLGHSPKFKKLANNKPFGAVRLSFCRHPFGQCLEG